MRALITGDRGFLGRHFTAELKRRGWDVMGMDVKASSAQDCRNFFRKRPQPEPHFDLVVHCAAVVGGRATIENDPLATAESLSIDAEMFRWAAVARPGRVLYFSSSAAYPVALQTGTPRLDLRENWVNPGISPGEPDQLYGWSKVTGERLAFDLRATGVPVTVVRPFSGYGADQDPSYPFRAILERARAGEAPLEVWCGDCVRDWIHVDDLVAGALAVMESGTEDPVNLCTGRPTSFLGLAQLMAAASPAYSSAPEVRFNPSAPQGVAYRVGDPERMLQYYTPKISIEMGVKRALER